MGTLLASVVGIILEQLLPNSNFAWRFAFILGGIMGIVGFYFRLRVSETPIFESIAEKKRTLKMPFFHVIRTSWRSMLITCSLGGAAGSIVYIVKTYINVFHCQVLNFDKTTSLIYISYASIVMIISMPISGYISDIIGKLKMITISSFAIVIFSIPAFILLSCHSISQQIIALTIIGILAGLIAGTAYVFIIALFKPEERFTGVAFSYNLGVAIFGGTSAVISRWLLELTQIHYAPAFYVMATSLGFLIVLYSLKAKIKMLLN